MSAKTAPVKAGPLEFDLGPVGDWALAHPYMFWGCVSAAFLFWICRKNGLLGLWLDYLKAKNESKTKVELGKQALQRKFGIAAGQGALGQDSTSTSATGNSKKRETK